MTTLSWVSVRSFPRLAPANRSRCYSIKEFREQYAGDHYTFAVKMVLGLVEEWRASNGILAPMLYVFDRGNPEEQINEVWEKCLDHPNAEQVYGIVPDGVQFQNKKLFKPLQAADVLAWQMQNHMRRTALIGRDPNDLSLMHEGFVRIRKKKSIDLGFFSTEQMRRMFERPVEFKQSRGIWPWEPNPLTARLRITIPGEIE